jgi:hypothetical protein
MVTRAELAVWLSSHPKTESGSVVTTMDRKNSVSSLLVRAKWDGKLTVAVGSDVPSSPAASALVDLVALWLVGGDRSAPVTLLLADGRPEVVDAARTLRSSLNGRVDVGIALLSDVRTEPVFDHCPAPDFSSSMRAVGYSRLLENWRMAEPFPIACHLAKLVDHPSLRLYPMLSQNPLTGHWSVRLDGLEVGRVGPATGKLDVGRTSPAGALSFARGRWLEVHPSGSFSFDDSTVHEAADLLSSLISKFPPGGLHTLDHRQPEHALESAVLRGLTSVVTSKGALVPWLEEDLVSRGSQFPTLWTESGKARYLDALVKDGSVPWAIELKVLKSGGPGSYCRHGLAQAVLYRHFIRSATPVHRWFRSAGTEPTTCRAAVAFPKAPQASRARVDSLRRLSGLFDVDVIELDV